MTNPSISRQSNLAAFIVKLAHPDKRLFFLHVNEENEMDIVKFADLPAYSPPEHRDIHLRQLQGGDASNADFVLVGHKTFSPKTRVPMEAAPVGNVYVVAEGVLTVEEADGMRHVLTQGDSVFVPANEARAVVNNSDKSAALIVIAPGPAK
jgi:quercetin dioxygenase-like cupin family protein